MGEFCWKPDLKPWGGSVRPFGLWFMTGTNTDSSFTGLYVSTLPQMTIEKNFFATIQGQALPLGTVSLCGHDEHIIEFDVEAAWYQLALRPGWSNELEVKVYFSMD